LRHFNGENRGSKLGARLKAQGMRTRAEIFAPDAGGWARWLCDTPG
jgi:hypothetical protein